MAGHTLVNSSDRCYIVDMPPEVILGVLKCMEIKDMARFQAVCKAFHDAVKEHKGVVLRPMIRDIADESMFRLVAAHHVAATAPWKPSKVGSNNQADYQSTVEYCQQYLVPGQRDWLQVPTWDLEAAYRAILFYKASLETARVCCQRHFKLGTGTHSRNTWLAKFHKALYHLSIIAHLFHSSPSRYSRERVAWDVFSDHLTYEEKMEIKFLDRIFFSIFFCG